MSDSQPVSLPQHLWEALDLMSQEIGVGRDSLVAQAVFTLARLNGFVVPGKVGGSPAAAANTGRSPSTSNLGAPRASQAAAPAPKPPAKAPARKAPEPDPEPEPDQPDEAGNPFAENSNESAGYNQDPEPEPEPEPLPKSGGKAVLTLVMAGRDPLKMSGDVFTIGRGKTCDFVIDSNRVSREHARILREGAGFVLEDLNSSNGTFFGPNKDKVTRRAIKDGDEFTFGTEKVKFLIRK